MAHEGFFTIFFQVLHLKGDRQDFDFVKSSLSAEGFDVVYDINGMHVLYVIFEPCIHCLFFQNSYHPVSLLHDMNAF